MPWDRKRLLGYVETIQLILGVTDKIIYSAYVELLFYEKHWDLLYKDHRNISQGQI